MAYTFKHGDRPLDGITVQRAVGRGGFGEVYYALTDSGKQVAVKYLRDNPEIELRGISHVMNLKSPHLITIYDVRKSASGEPFVIMEYVSGPSLRELMTAESGGMGLQKAAFLLTGICKGLSYLHERGIVHRDLKPANIFYDDGYVKIGDYGLSKHMSVSQHSGQTVSVGTVHYMAPEIGSGSYTKAIDIYAVGVILYEMLTGRLPFSGSSMAEILMKHVREQPNLMGVPQPFAAVIAKALAKDPSERYQDANEMLAAVMEHASFNQDAASFDASQLTVARRNEPREADDQTVTSPSPAPRAVPPPPMDVRSVEDYLGALPDRLQKKIERLGRKLEKKTAKLERKSGRRRRQVGADPVAPRRPDVLEPAYSDITVARGGRFAQIVVIALIAVIASAGLDFLFIRRNGSYHDEPLLTVALVMALGGGLLGVMLAHFQVLSRLITRSEMLDRFVYASLAGLLMLPSLGPGLEAHRQFGWVLVAPLACLMICNWNERIDSARRGMNEGWGWSMFWPALVGFIAMQMVDAEKFNLIAAGVCALFSALTHTAAALWPYPLRPTTPIDGAAGPASVPPATSGDEWEANADNFAARVATWEPPVGDAKPMAGGAAHAAWPGVHTSPGAMLVAPVPRNGLARALFWLFSALALFVTLGTFIGLMFVRGKDDAATAALLSMVLVSLAWQPFLLWKALHAFKRPAWFGTVRPLILTLIAQGFIAIGMVGMFGDLHGNNWLSVLIPGAVIFIAGLIVLFTPGTPWRAQDIRGPAVETNAAPPAIGAAIVYDARGHRSGSIGTALVAIALLMAISTAFFSWRTHERIRIGSIELQADPPRVAIVPRAPGTPVAVRVPGPNRVPGPATGVAPPAPVDVESPSMPEPPESDDPGAVFEPHAHAERAFGRLPLLVMTPLALGAGFLLWSRRGQGWMPALRTAGGCGLLFALAASLTSGDVLGSSGVISSETFGPITYERSASWGELAKLAGFAVGAAVLLLWPRGLRRTTASAQPGF